MPGLAPMLGKRILVVVLLLPVLLAVNALGGLAFAAFFAFFLGVAAFEYCRLFRQRDLQPSYFITIAGTVALLLLRSFFDLNASGAALALLVLLAMAVHLFAYERGRDAAGADFAATLGGLAYLGWLGSYFIALRTLPDGQWWVLLTLPAVWVPDTGAYFIGRAFGKHKMSPRLSPGKSWEGYAGGVVSGVLGGLLLAYLWGQFAPAIQPWHGALMGLVFAVVTPLGDLGESMIKRMVGAKDSGSIFPGHGGVMDRIDSWLWAAVIGYYMITALFL